MFALTGMCLFIISLAGCLFAKPLCASVRLCLKKSVCMGMCMYLYAQVCVQLITSTKPVVTAGAYCSVRVVCLIVCEIKLVLSLSGIIQCSSVLS